MERRQSDRVKVNLKAERITCTENCSVFIENLSETGIYMITAPPNNRDYTPGSEIDLELELNNGKVISLFCHVKWAIDNSPEYQTNSVGLEIMNPPLEYKEFVKNLH